MTAITACRTCGAEPREGARFCDGCGAPVTGHDVADFRSGQANVRRHVQEHPRGISAYLRSEMRGISPSAQMTVAKSPASTCCGIWENTYSASEAAGLRLNDQIAACRTTSGAGGVASEVSRFVVSGGSPLNGAMTSPGNVIPPSSRARGAVDVECEGPTRASTPSAATPPMIHPVASRRRADSVRLCVGRPLGHDIDGAWWPRADRIANELPHLVAVLTPLLGHITSINVSWPPLQRPPDLNWLGWRYKPQHVMTVNGDDASANLLIVPYATHSALALMVLRCAANLPINPTDRETPAFLTAGSILLAAQQQCAATKAGPIRH
jgi:Family of unknown function (DUF5994)